MSIAVPAMSNLRWMHRMDKRKSFVFARQYRNCFSQRINVLVLKNQPIKTAVGIVMHDFHGFSYQNIVPKVIWLLVTRADQNTGGALLEFPVRTAMHEESRVSSAIKYNFSSWTTMGIV